MLSASRAPTLWRIVISASMTMPLRSAAHQQRLHRRLTFRRLVLCFRKLRDVGPGIFERDELVAARTTGSDRRKGLPAAIRHQGTNYAACARRDRSERTRAL